MKYFKSVRSNRDVEKALVTNSSGSRVSKRLETVVVLDTTAHICRDGHVDFLWIRKLEIAHNFNKVLHGLIASKSRIGIFLGTNSRFSSALVIVGGIDDSRFGQRKKLALDGLVQVFCRSSLKVGSAASLDQEGVSRQDKGFVTGNERDTPFCVTRGRSYLEVVVSKDNLVAVVHGTIRCRPRSLGNYALETGDGLFEEPCSSDVVGVGMCVESIHKVQTQGFNLFEIALDLCVDGIDDERVFCGFVPQKVGVGTGFFFKQLLDADWWLIGFGISGTCSACGKDGPTHFIVGGMYWC